MNATRWLGLAALVGFLAGCGTNATRPMAGTGTPPASAKASEQKDEEAAIQKALAALDPEDRQAAEAQRFCAVMDENRLGSMGKPVKLMLKEQPVFLCCAGCRKKAERDPDKTLARVEALRAKEAEPQKKPTAPEKQ